MSRRSALLLALVTAPGSARADDGPRRVAIAARTDASIAIDGLLHRCRSAALGAAVSGSAFTVPGSHSHGVSGSAEVAVQARSNLDLALGPSSARSVDDNVYMAAVTGAAGETHHVLANVVLRWEYRPGSALFLIWSHGRTSVGPDGRFSVRDDLADLAGEPGEHVLMANLTYWL